MLTDHKEHGKEFVKDCLERFKQGGATWKLCHCVELQKYTISSVPSHHVTPRGCSESNGVGWANPHLPAQRWNLQGGSCGGKDWS